MPDTKEVVCVCCNGKFVMKSVEQTLPIHYLTCDMRELECGLSGKPNPVLGKPKESKMKDSVNHPAHYQAKNDPNGTYEAIKVIEVWELGFCLGNTVKYISRAGKKDAEKIIEDLKKASWYLNREIERLEKG